MAREITFRGQRVDTKEWVYGDLIHGVGAKKNNLYILPGVVNLAYLPGCHPLDGFQIIPETVGQYTGLKDRNYKEIFEGDVAMVHLFIQELGMNFGVTEGEREYKGVIEFWEYGIALNIGDNENNFYLTLAPGMLHEESFEVIGNIYEHKELIQQPL